MIAVLTIDEIVTILNKEKSGSQYSRIKEYALMLIAIVSRAVYLTKRSNRTILNKLLPTLLSQYKSVDNFYRHFLPSLEPHRTPLMCFQHQLNK